MPIVESCFVWIAIFNLVPTPSVAATKIGSLNPAAFRSNKPPNPPMAEITPVLLVFFKLGLMRCTNSLPASISTPASE